MSKGTVLITSILIVIYIQNSMNIFFPAIKLTEPMSKKEKETVPMDGSGSVLFYK